MSKFRTAMIAASAVLASMSIGAGSASASGWDPFGNNNGSNARSTLDAQPARADSCSFQQQIKDKAGNIVGTRTVDGCAQ